MAEKSISVEIFDITGETIKVVNKSALPEIGLALETSFLSVEDTKEEFKVELKIHTIYKDPKHITPDPTLPDVFERVQNYPGFIPDLQVENVEASYDNFFVVTNINPRDGLIWTSFKNTFTIQHFMQLERFPFDRQIFFVNVMGVNCRMVKWNYDTKVLGFNEPDKNQYLNGTPKGWDVPGIRGFFVPAEDSAFGMETMGTAILIERAPFYYGFNYAIVIFFIIITNVCAIAVPTEDAADRNSLTITLLLTLVAFKFVLMQGVPKLTYMTYMDKYVMVAFLFIMLAIVENSVLALEQLENVIDPAEFDLYFQIIYVSVWILMHILVFAAIRYPRIMRAKWEAVYRNMIDEAYRTVLFTEKVYNLGDEDEVYMDL